VKQVESWVSINNDDLVKMLDAKINKRLPSEYLYSILDELLIDLEK
jgi:hypothetical protein